MKTMRGVFSARRPEKGFQDESQKLRFEGRLLGKKSCRFEGENRMKGLLFTLEGPEGAGKTTQIQKLANALRERGIPCSVVREPGGTVLGDRIRHLLLDPKSGDIGWRAEMLLYAASRAQLVEQVIRPALERGECVLCDRYVDSSLVYQGFAAKGDLNEVRRVNEVATGGLWPNRTYLLDLPTETGLDRLGRRGTQKDRMEQKEQSFHERVRQGYLQLAREESDRIFLVPAWQSEEEVFRIIWEDMERFLKKRV
jgi:dTMP kinase